VFLLYLYNYVSKPLSLIVFVGFLFRLIFAWLQNSYDILPYVWDEVAFQQTALNFSNYLLGIDEIPFDIYRINSVSSYGSFLGTIYFIFGQDPIIGRLVSVIFGSLVIFFAYKIAKNFNISDKKNYILCCIVALTPSYIIFSGLIMRDSLIWFLMYYFIYVIYKLYENKNKFQYLVKSILIIIPLVLLRKQYAALFAVYFVFIIVHLIIERDYYFINLRVNFIKYLFISMIFLSGIVFSYNILVYELSSFDKTDLMDYISSQISWRAQGGSAYLSHLEYNSIFDVFKNVPLKFYYFVYGPFLWSSTSAFTMLAAVENIVVWIFSFLFIKNFKIVFNQDNENYRFILFLSFFVFTSLAANAVIDSNFGTAMRHRMVYLPLFYIIVLSVFQNKKFT